MTHWKWWRLAPPLLTHTKIFIKISKKNLTASRPPSTTDRPPLKGLQKIPTFYTHGPAPSSIFHPLSVRPLSGQLGQQCWHPGTIFRWTLTWTSGTCCVRWSRCNRKTGKPMSMLETGFCTNLSTTKNIFGGSWQGKRKRPTREMNVSFKRPGKRGQKKSMRTILSTSHQEFSAFCVTSWKVCLSRNNKWLKTFLTDFCYFVIP